MREKITASLIHLCFSILLVLGVFLTAVLIWYPGLYFKTMGVGKVLLIVALVDVAIGPLVTLIIFNRAKKSLKFDLGIIAGLQLIALAYGVNTIFSGRPVYLVYNIDRFTIVSAADILTDDLNKAGIRALPISGPQTVGAHLPGDPKERARILFSSMEGHADLPQMPQYYLPYQKVVDDVMLRMLSLETLMKRQSKLKVIEARQLIANTMSENNLHITDVGFIPVQGKMRDLTMVVRRGDASIVRMLPIDPWSD